MKKSDWSHLLYWGSLALLLLAGSALTAVISIPFTPDLEGLSYLGLIFLHMGAGHYFGYQGMLKKKYRAVSWRREYQRALAVMFSLLGVGWIAASLLSQGAGIYALIFTALFGLLYSNWRLGQLMSQDKP